jgi:glycosyltransferase involved in cell wall biosynthesis
MLEGTSPSLLSAMSAGLCCLVNDLPEHRSTAGESVAYFNRDDEDHLVHCWQSLLDDPERRAALGATARAHQRRFYDWDVIAGQYIDLFREVTVTRGAAGTLRSSR